MKVTVKTIDAQSIQLDVEAELTVSALKKIIVDKLQLTDKNIRLIWRGKVLNDDKKLSEYDAEELTLHLVYKAPPKDEGDDGTSSEGKNVPVASDVTQDSTQASTSTNEASAVPPSLEAAPSQAPPTEDDKEREARERRERAQEYRTQKNIRGHVRTAYRCMQHADRVLLRYKKARIRASGQDPGDEDIKRISEVDRMLAINHGTTDGSIYVALLNYQERLSSKARELTEHMVSTVTREQQHEELEAWTEAQIAQTVREFNYYMGHASVSLSRLHVNMFAPPPRVIVSTTPKTTEMRGIMSQMRSMHAAPRPPPGYIIEISHTDETGRERTTRAQLNTGGRTLPGGGLFGALGRGGGLGGMGRSGGGGGGGLMEMMRQQKEQKEKEQKEAKKSEAATSTDDGGEKAMETEPNMPSSEKMEAEQKEEHMDTGPADDPDEPKPKPPAAVSSSGGQSTGTPAEPKAEEGDKSDDKPKTKGGDKDEEGNSTNSGDPPLAEAIPDYLARLVAHIVAGRPMEPIEEEKKKEEGATGGEPIEGENEEKEWTFAQRFAGPKGTKVTIKQPPQPAMFPGMAPVEGPSITIDNTGDEPEMAVNFPMPPALQFLRNLLMRDSDDEDSGDEEGDKKEKKDDSEKVGSKKSEASDVKEKGSGPSEAAKPSNDGSKVTEEPSDAGKPESSKDEGDKSLSAGKKKSTRKPDEEPLRSELWGEDKDEVESISNAGSLDSLDSDHEIPPIDPPVIVPASGAAPGLAGRESMLDTFTQLRQRYVGMEGANDEEEDMGMVERLLQDISKELSVLEVMSVFNGDTGPLGRLQPILKEFIREKLLFGEIPRLDASQEEMAVKNFVQECLPSLRAVEDQLPLRDQGIDFPQTIYRLFSTQFRAAYRLIVRDYTETASGGGAAFSLVLSHWAKSTSVLFAQVLRHCINGEQYFEDLVKTLVNTLFPPTTPPLILNMCNSTIYRQLSRVKERPTKSPIALDLYIVWKEGATPTPNQSYDLRQYLADQSDYCAEMPITFLHYMNPDGVEVTQSAEFIDPPPPELPEEWGEVAKRDRKTMASMKAMPFSDAYLAGMPSKKRKLDLSTRHTIPAEQLTQTLVTKAISGLAPQGNRNSQEVMATVLESSQSLANALRDDIHRGITHRLMEDPNFSQEKCPNAYEYFQVPPK